MGLKIKSKTSKLSGLTSWSIEDEYGGIVFQSPGFVDPAECQRHLDIVRKAFHDEIVQGEGQ